MSWENQGRQSHGWFGSGTGPYDDAVKADIRANKLFEPANAAQRVDYVAFSLVGHVPRNERSRWDAALSGSARDSLKTAFAVWYNASSLSRDAFRTQLLDPYTSDETVDRLRSAAQGIIEAQSYGELSKAGEDLAAAAQQVGVDRWPRYLNDPKRRAVPVPRDESIPHIMNASASGTDSVSAGAVILGGILVYLSLKSLSKRLNTAPQATMTQAQPFAVEASVPIPPPKEGETSTDVLKPGGRLVGQRGSGPKVRELPGGKQGAEELFDRLTKGGNDATPPDYPGQLIRLPNGDTIGYRAGSKSGPPTLDVNVSGVGRRKFKFPGK